MESQTFNSVFNALTDTPVEAANMKARFELLSALKTLLIPGIYRKKQQQLGWDHAPTS